MFRQSPLFFCLINMQTNTFMGCKHFNLDGEMSLEWSLAPFFQASTLNLVSCVNVS